jgi:hypothetical protein
MKHLDNISTARNLRAMLTGKDLDDLSAILTLLRVATSNDAVMAHPELSTHIEKAYRIKAIVQDA